MVVQGDVVLMQAFPLLCLGEEKLKRVPKCRQDSPHSHLCSAWGAVWLGAVLGTMC